MLLIRSKDLDNPETTQTYHAQLIKKKPYLKKIYIDYYTQFKSSVHPTKKLVLVELGSGGGFIKEIMPHVITSDVMKLKNVDKKFSALKMPFKNNSVDAFFMIDVLHHISDTEKFFKEAQRCLKQNGKIVMVEPANTLWGGFVSKYLHHEAYAPKSVWKFTSRGPLSSSNLALAWIIFFRDKDIFKKLFPHLKVSRVKAHTPFRYLVSGGLSRPQLLPSWTYPFVLNFENKLGKLNEFLGMFYTIEIIKTK